MKIAKPNYLVHNDDKERPLSIFSVAIHPDGTRLASGGLDTKIKIWSTNPILNREAELDESIPKLLCTMTSHSGVVMCVRWSNSGRYLASGSDDNIVMIWNLETGSGGKVWGSEETNLENWKAVKRLVGHDSDVAGVAWSSDDAYLASVGLDSTVLIWSGGSFDLIRKLTGHEGFVKGVVFDPVGQYLATQSDDNSVKIWRTDDWKLEADIRAPFLESPKTNLSRLSWSPDGVHIVTPNSMNGPVFVAAVINRKTWDSPVSMVGHENIVEVAAYNPILFLRDPKKPVNGANLCTLLALSARNSISLWVTNRSQPTIVLDEVFDRDVLDMSWSADGTQLWSCSSEGHVAVFEFALSEFATVAPAGTKEMYHKTYNYQRRAPELFVPLGSQTNGSSLGGSIGTMAKPNMLVSRKGPGAKRIVPKLVQPIQPLFNPPPIDRVQPISFNPPPIDHHSAIPNYQYPVASTSNEGGWGGPDDIPRKRKAHFEQEEYEDRMTSYSRISEVTYRGNGRTLGENRIREVVPDLRELRPTYAPREREITFEISNKENRIEGGKGVRVLAIPAIQTFGSLQVEDGEAKDTLEWRNFGEGDKKGGSEIAVVTVKKTLWIDYLSSYIVCAAGSPAFVAVSTEEGSLHVYSPTGRRLLPTIILDSPCSLLEAEGDFLMAITSLGTLHVWNTSKSKIVFPSLPLSTLLTSSATSKIPHPTITTSALLPNGSPLIALSSGSTFSYDLDLSIWTRLSEPWWSQGSDYWEGRKGKNGSTARSVVKGIENAVNDFLVDAALVASEAENGERMEVIAENGVGSEKKDTVLEGSVSEPVGDKEMFRTAVSLGHLEIRMKAAVSLGSANEYKGFLFAYTKKLAEEGIRAKAEELVKEMLGPIYFKPGTTQVWNATVLIYNKRDLLKDILSIFSKSKMLTTLGTEYQEILKQISN